MDGCKHALRVVERYLKDKSQSIFCDVLILGAGISGLAAAKVLSSEGFKTITLEARSRNGGRIHTIDLPNNKPDGSQYCVDLGASYLHGCDNSPEGNPLFTLASRLKILTTPAAGDVLGAHRGWECPEVATWRDNKTGKEISLQDVADMSFLLDRCLLFVLMQCNNKRKKLIPLSTAMPRALKASLLLLNKSGHRPTTRLSNQERGIFDSLFARYIAYVNPADRLPSRLPLGPHYELDAKAGLALDANQPSLESKMHHLRWLEEKRTYLAKFGPKKSVARRTTYPWEDRLVLNGFAKFVDFLSTGLDIHQRSIVKHIYWPVHDAAAGVKRPRFDVDKCKLMADRMTKWTSKSIRQFVNMFDLVCVEVVQYDASQVAWSWRNQVSKRYFAPFCIVTVPVGVLKGLDRRSSIQFNPQLPIAKRMAIEWLGIPRIGAETHNKVVLMFNACDVFWDKHSPHLSCPGARLHILNCDFYGNPGVLVAHIWGGSKLKLTGKPDSEVVSDLLELLSGMYPQHRPLPMPIFTHVARWSEDAFSLGSYTAGEIGSSDVHRHAYAASLPSSNCPRLLFAGEGTVDSEGAQQCTHGAFSSGIERAFEILDYTEGRRCRLRDSSIIDYFLGKCSNTRRNVTLSPPSSTIMKRKFLSVKDDTTRQRRKRRKIVQDSSSSSLSSSAHFSVKQSANDSGVSTLNNESIDTTFRRRSNRYTTWISSQASSSLHSHFKLIIRRKRYSPNASQKSVTTATNSSSSNSSRHSSSSIDSFNDYSSVDQYPSISIIQSETMDSICCKDITPTTNSQELPVFYNDLSNSLSLTYTNACSTPITKSSSSNLAAAPVSCLPKIEPLFSSESSNHQNLFELSFITPVGNRDHLPSSMLIPQELHRDLEVPKVSNLITEFGKTCEPVFGARPFPANIVEM